MPAEDFPVQVRDLHAWTSLGTHAGITAHPLGPHAPEIWILGSSDYGAQLAAHFGLPYAFAYFFTDGQGAELAMALYRQRFQPSERHPLPQATLCIWALAADSDEEAAHLALSRDRWRIDRQRGALGPLQSPDAIAERGFSEAELAMLAPMREQSLRRLGRHGRREDPQARERLRARRGGDQHLGLRPGGAAPFLRADRQGVRAGAGLRLSLRSVRR